MLSDWRNRLDHQTSGGRQSAFHPLRTLPLSSFLQERTRRAKKEASAFMEVVCRRVLQSELP
jgi:hypothetical protein